MSGEWQTIIAIAIVLVAASYLIRRTWLSIVRKRASRCGACASCPAGDASAASASPAGQTSASLDPNGKPLVQLSGIARSPQPSADR